MKKLLVKLFNKETITYVIFGGLTTVVNYAVYYLFYKFTMADPVVYNIIAWVVAVLFAFITNKLFVFESRTFKADVLFTELASFVGARLLSLIFETAFIALTVKVFNMNELVAKIITAVFVIIFNYFASKFFIFKKKPSVNDEGGFDD